MHSKRLFDRKSITRPIELSTDSITVPGIAQDLSPTGAFVKVAVPLTEGQVCALTIFIDPEDPDAAAIEVEARIARVLEHGMGLEFTNMSIASVGLLHRLLSSE